MVWGWSMTIDCRKCNMDVITNPELLQSWITELVTDLEMEAYGDAHIVHFGKDDKTGNTVVQLIQTSNITAHLCDQTGDAYVDVFSCKPFTQETVLLNIDKWLQPTVSTSKMIDRQA